MNKLKLLFFMLLFHNFTCAHFFSELVKFIKQDYDLHNTSQKLNAITDDFSKALRKKYAPLDVIVTDKKNNIIDKKIQVTDKKEIYRRKLQQQMEILYNVKNTRAARFQRILENLETICILGLIAAILTLIHNNVCGKT